MVLIDRFFWGLAVIAGVLAGGMMVLTFSDVLARYLFNSPIRGAFEITEMLMGVVVFGALPLVTMRRQHVVDSILFDKLPLAVRRVLAVGFDLLGATVCAVMAWRMWLYGERLSRFGEVTLELRISKGMVCMGMAVLVAFAALAFLLAAIDVARRGPVRVGVQEDM